MILWLKRIINKNKGKFEVWDTSAISLWLDLLKQHIKQGIHIIVTEGGLHELSAGRHTNKACREAYYFICDMRQKGKVFIQETADITRAWTVDEQVVFIANVYHKKGLDVTLITCDRDQADKASLKKGLKFKLLDGNREEVKQGINAKVLKDMIQKNTPKYNPIKQLSEIKNLEDELIIPFVLRGKDGYINIKHNVTVLDNKGKRRIGQGDFIRFNLSDTMLYDNVKYKIKTMSDNNLILEKR